MSTIDAAGMRIECSGDAGSTVILLHGLGGTSNTWQPLLSALAGRRVVRPDLPGAGRSPVPEGALTVRRLTAAILAMAESLGIESATLIGHSFGTLLAQHVAMARPTLVRGLLLFGPIIEPIEAARERLRRRAQLARSGAMDTIADQVLDTGLAVSSQQDGSVASAYVRECHMRQDAEGFARSCEALALAQRAELAMLKVPVTLVTGDEDVISPPSVAYRMADEIPGAKVEMLYGCGHWAPLEKPADCRRLVAEFVAAGG